MSEESMTAGAGREPQSGEANPSVREEAEAQVQPPIEESPEVQPAAAEAPESTSEPEPEATQPQDAGTVAGEPAPEPEAESAETASESPADEAEPVQEYIPASETTIEDVEFDMVIEAVDADRARLKAIIEAVIYITDEPLSTQQIAGALGKPVDQIRSILDDLTAEYSMADRGLSIREVAGGFKMATKPEHHEEIRSFVKNLKPPLKLSLAALETLAVIAYKQPITAPEIMEIRGVQGAGVLKTLLDRKLIATAGRKNVIGKPILYKTTKEFLVQFGLKDLSELPTLKEFEELGRLALTDADAEPGEWVPAQLTMHEPGHTPERPAVDPEAVPVDADAAAAEEPAPGGEPETPEPPTPVEEPPSEPAPIEAPPSEPEPAPQPAEPVPPEETATESNG